MVLWKNQWNWQVSSQTKKKKKEANYRKLLVSDIKQGTSLKKSVKLMSLARLRKKKEANYRKLLVPDIKEGTSL